MFNFDHICPPQHLVGVTLFELEATFIWWNTSVWNKLAEKSQALWKYRLMKYSFDLVDGQTHDDVIKWKLFARYWPFVWGIHRSPVNSPHKGQWLGALMFSLICAWINGWLNNRAAGDLRRHRAQYDVFVMARREHFICQDSKMTSSSSANPMIEL